MINSILYKNELSIYHKLIELDYEVFKRNEIMNIKNHGISINAIAKYKNFGLYACSNHYVEPDF